MGGPDAEGIEAPGISFYFLNGGAKAVMASLWLLNDASTSLFMQQFYTELSAGNFSTIPRLVQFHDLH
ncbi:MAG: CHAT domain-containing protein [Pseudanabaenales cyanobacterium]|nr:CHAT domain-containing protein [Pseudanabaenales cyanobacterium]